jgi:hypothetical protein
MQHPANRPVPAKLRRGPPAPLEEEEEPESLTQDSYSADANDEPHYDEEEDLQEQTHEEPQEEEEGSPRHISSRHELEHIQEDGSQASVHFSHPTLPPRIPAASHMAAPVTPQSVRHIPQQFSPEESFDGGMATVPPSPPTGATAHPIPQPRGRLLDAGLAAMKKNLVPGIALQCVALLIIIVYFSSSSAQAGFNQLADFKASTGYLFSGISTMIFGGLLPMLIAYLKKEWTVHRAAKAALLATGLDISAAGANAGSVLPHEPVPLDQHHVLINGHDTLEQLQLDVQTTVHMVAPVSDGTIETTGAVTLGAHRGPSYRAELLFMALFWCWKGIEVDAFYRLQALIWGSDQQFGTIVGKVVTDQFLYNPPWAAPSCLAAYYWKDTNFSFTRTWSYITARHFWMWTVPECLMSVWLVS